MTVVVAEYLGVRTDMGYSITPVVANKNGAGVKPSVPCPFKNSHCDKAKRGDKPVCSVRDTANGNQLWIVCSSRLCATTPKGATLSDYQKFVLMQVASQIYDSPPQCDVKVDREVKVPVAGGSAYSADYVMWRDNPRTNGLYPDRPVVLEMQGGGETTNTGAITAHITAWETGHVDINAVVQQAAPLVTNAWRRQQEQFLVKGNVAMQSGGKLVFCIGSMIYDYLVPRLDISTNLSNLRNANWTLALLTFKEDSGGLACPPPAEKSIPLVIDNDRSIFTTYSSFVQAITNQGSPCSELFDRPYQNL